MHKLCLFSNRNCPVKAQADRRMVGIVWGRPHVFQRWSGEVIAQSPLLGRGIIKQVTENSERSDSALGDYLCPRSARFCPACPCHNTREGCRISSRGARSAPLGSRTGAWNLMEAAGWSMVTAKAEGPHRSRDNVTGVRPGDGFHSQLGTSCGKQGPAARANDARNDRGRPVCVPASHSQTRAPQMPSHSGHQRFPWPWR